MRPACPGRLGVVEAEPIGPAIQIADVARLRLQGGTSRLNLMNRLPRRFGLLAVAVIAALAIAIPVIAADPSPASSPPGQTKPDVSEKPDESTSSDQADKAAKAGKPAKVPEIAVTVDGTVHQATGDKGRPTFTITAGGKVWELSDGPPWYWGDNDPLKAYVGKSVKVAGSTAEGSTELEVESVNGTAIRAAGKPPWAGGPWVVGPTHPGWKPWMADGKPGNGHGQKTAPGQNKDKSPDSTEDGKPGD